MQAASQPRPLADAAEWRQYRCSSCGRDVDHARFLASGAFGGTICDRCCLQALAIFLRAHLGAARRMIGIGRRGGRGGHDAA